MRRLPHLSFAFQSSQSPKAGLNLHASGECHWFFPHKNDWTTRIHLGHSPKYYDSPSRASQMDCSTDIHVGIEFFTHQFLANNQLSGSIFGIFNVHSIFKIDGRVAHEHPNTGYRRKWISLVVAVENLICTPTFQEWKFEKSHLLLSLQTTPDYPLCLDITDWCNINIFCVRHLVGKLHNIPS